MDAIGVIPARGGSQRVPRKNLLPLLGKPLVAYAIEAARKASSLKRVIVSTDSTEIASIAEEFGAEVLQRPAELATNEAAIDDSLRHVVSTLKQREGYVPDIVVLMQANNPVRKSGEIDEVVAKLRAHPSATAVVTAYRVTQRPEWAKVVVDEQTMEVRPFMDSDTKFRMQDLPVLYLFDGSVMAVRREVLERTAGDRRVHAYLGDHVLLVAHDAKYAAEIDNVEDLEEASYYLSREH